MPPSIHRLTPAEKRLRRAEYWRDRGHDPFSSSCFWAHHDAWGTASCEPCSKLREAMMP